MPAVRDGYRYAKQLAVRSEWRSMRGAANALRNQAAAMGGNVIYGVSSPTQNLLSSFIPTDSQMNGQVYKCPN